MSKIAGFLALTALISSQLVMAQAPKVGRKAAAKYLGGEPARDTASRGGGENVLMLHIGKYISSQAYNWKDPGKVDDIGRSTYGVTYLFTDWGGMDVNLRADFTEYDFVDIKATKFSLLPVWSFPRAETRFPLYFGFGVGVGVYFQQVPSKSNLSADYQLMMGARFMDLAPGFGAFLEYGLKNHLHLLGEGQFNGTALTAGAVFSF